MNLFIRGDNIKNVEELKQCKNEVYIWNSYELEKNKNEIKEYEEK